MSRMHAFNRGEAFVKIDLVKQVAEYYGAEANDYDAAQGKPERLREVAKIGKTLAHLFSGLRVLEIACGTGTWTEFIAQSAKSVMATDVNQEMLDIASVKLAKFTNIEFQLKDGYRLDFGAATFNAVFCGLWISHVPRQMLATFLVQVRSLLESGDFVVIVDHRFVQDEMIPLTGSTDAEGNSFSSRCTSDGRSWLITKNFLNEDEIRTTMTSVFKDVSIESYRHFWVAKCLV